MSRASYIPKAFIDEVVVKDITVDNIMNSVGSIRTVANIAAKVDTITDLLQIDTSKLETGEQFYVLGYHTRNDGGGGIFYWDADEDKANHNGGTIIDPTQPFPNDWSDILQQNDWFTASGSGNGCWKRVHDNNIDVGWFGAKNDPAVDSGNIIKHICNTFTGNITLIINDIFYIISDVTIPENVNLKFFNGGILNVLTQDISNEDVGTGDGSTTKFSLAYSPVLENSETIYVDGVEQTRNSNYTINYETGVITFTSAPANGASVIVNYTRRFKLTINGGIDAGLFQIFDGDGVVTGKPKIEAVYPEWWGNDFTIAMAKAIQSFSKISLCPNKTYEGYFTIPAVADPNDATYQLEIIGNQAIIKPKSSDPYGIGSTTAWGNRTTITDVIIDTSNLDDSKYGLDIEHQWSCRYERIYTNRTRIRTGVYVTKFVNCSLGNLSIQGSSLSSMVTTLSFNKCSIGLVNLNYGSNITFKNCLLSDVDMDCSFAITFMNNDFEYISDHAYSFGSNMIGGIYSIGNTIPSSKHYYVGNVPSYSVLLDYYYPNDYVDFHTFQLPHYKRLYFYASSGNTYDLFTIPNQKLTSWKVVVHGMGGNPVWSGVWYIMAYGGTSNYKIYEVGSSNLTLSYDVDTNTVQLTVGGSGDANLVCSYYKLY